MRINLSPQTPRTGCARPVGLLAALALLTACSTPAPAPTSASPNLNIPATIALADLPTWLADLQCTQEAADGKWHRYALGTCEADFAVAIQFMRDRLRLAELGRITYDGGAASVCLRSSADLATTRRITGRLTAYGKSSLPNVAVDPACLQVFTGHLATGTDCDDDAECAAGLRCWGCPGVCRAPVATGAACGTPTAVCGDADLCIGGVCVPTPALGLGGVCQDLPAPHEQLLAEQIPCAAGLACQPTSTDALAPWACGTSHGTAAAGSPCTDATSCASGLCKGQVCTTVADGTSCGGSSDCLDKACVPAGPSQKVCWSTANPALPCGTTGCPTGQYCSLIAGALGCKPLPLPGEACGDSDLCVNGLCDAKTGLCIDEYRPGCAASCQSFACAVNGACSVKDVGDSCTADAECNQWIATNKCVNGVCRRFGPLNRACPK